MRIKAILAAVFLCVLAFSFTAEAEEKYPKPLGFVSDFTGILPVETKTRIETKLRDYAKKTSIEIAVVIIPSLTQADELEEAQKIGEDWGVGKKGKDNGIILLFSLKERKIRIHVGYGLEGDMPDAKAKVLIEKLVSEMRKSVSQGIEIFVDEIKKELGDTPFLERKKDGGSWFWMIVIVIVIAVILIILDVTFTEGIFVGLILNIAIGVVGGDGDSGFGGGSFGGGGAGGSW